MYPKTIGELKAARNIVNQAVLNNVGLTEVQKALLMGMSCALVWASGEHNDTMGRLLGGELLAPGKPHGPAMERFDTGVKRIKEQM